MEQLADQVAAGNFANVPLDILYLIVEQYLTRREILNLCRTSTYFKNRICLYSSASRRDRLEKLWENLWYRDISSSLSLIRDNRKEYLDAASQLEHMNIYQAINYADINGYDQLLDSLLTELEQKGPIVYEDIEQIGRIHHAGDIFAKHNIYQCADFRAEGDRCMRLCLPGDEYCVQHWHAPH